MMRWIAFDDETAEAVVSRFKRGGAEIYPGEPLDAVLEFGKPSLMLLPSTRPGKVLLAQFQPKSAISEPPTNTSPASQRRFTSGFWSAFKSMLPLEFTWSAIRKRSPPVSRS